MIKVTAPSVFDGKRFLCENSIVVIDEEGIILDIQENRTIQAQSSDNTLAFDEGILCPAFVNAHCHIELSHLKGKIPQHQGMAKFLNAVISRPKQCNLIINKAIHDANKSMWQEGIQAVGDIVNSPNSIKEKVKSKLIYYNFIEMIDTLKPKDNIQDVLKLKQEFINHQLRASITPHAPYTVSPQQFSQLKNINAANSTLSIHYNESKDEKTFLQNKKSAFTDFLQNLYKNNALVRMPYNHWLNSIPTNTNLLLVHNTFIDEDDIKTIQEIASLKKCNFFFCLCPNANQYITGHLPPLDILEAYNCRWCIGTDSCASNNQLSIIEEMKVIKSAFPKISMSQLLRSATSEGAKALGMNNELGSLKEGLKSGLIHLSKASQYHLQTDASVKRIR